MKKLLILYVIIMLAALVLLFKMSAEETSGKRDMVAYNDRLHNAYDAYLAGHSAAEIEAQCGCILLLEPNQAELTRLYAEYALVMDFAPEGEPIGKIAWRDVREQNEAGKNSFRTTALIFWGVMLVLGLALLLAVDRYLLRPNREMRAYAGEIAKGNLDVPLPIRRNNPFGNLTESFDLMREELRASKEREAEAEKAKKELVAELAHDIKTPVATIRATCEVLELRQQRRIDRLTAVDSEETTDPDSLRRAADDAREASVAEARDVLEKARTIGHKTETIQQLMDNVFTATLEELDHIEVNPAEENSTIIEEYFRNLRNYGNIILENEIPSCLVYMDRLRMEQVIDNVVGNSHKYAGTDIHVRFDETVRKDRDGAGASYIMICIRDDGPGAPEEELPLLMSKYYRGSTAKDKAGFGMGLYLVRSYMEKQGGGAEIYNDNGFVVTLYLRKV
jgi:signal transduction histidine kinase